MEPDGSVDDRLALQRRAAGDVTERAERARRAGDGQAETAVGVGVSGVALVAHLHRGVGVPGAADLHDRRRPVRLVQPRVDRGCPCPRTPAAPARRCCSPCRRRSRGSVSGDLGRQRVPLRVDRPVAEVGAGQHRQVTAAGARAVGVVGVADPQDVGVTEVALPLVAGLEPAGWSPFDGMASFDGATGVPGGTGATQAAPKASTLATAAKAVISRRKGCATGRSSACRPAALSRS